MTQCIITELNCAISAWHHILRKSYMSTDFKNVLPHSNYSIWSLQLVWCCLILTKRREMKAKGISLTLLSWREEMGTTPPYWTMLLSLSFRIGLEEFRKAEQSKINKQIRTKQDSLHNTPFIYKEGLSSNSIYSRYPRPNIRVQVGFCFFPFLDMYLMINHLQVHQTLLILEQCGLNID